MGWTTKELVVLGDDDKAPLRSRDAQGYLTAIVQVSEPNYVPNPVWVRLRISPTKFEGAMPASALEEVRADSKVEAVTEARRQELGW